MKYFLTYFLVKMLFVLVYKALLPKLRAKIGTIFLEEILAVYLNV